MTPDSWDLLHTLIFLSKEQKKMAGFASRLPFTSPLMVLM